MIIVMLFLVINIMIVTKYFRSVHLSDRQLLEDVFAKCSINFLIDSNCRARFSLTLTLTLPLFLSLLFPFSYSPLAAGHHLLKPLRISYRQFVCLLANCWSICKCLQSQIVVQYKQCAVSLPLSLHLVLSLSLCLGRSFNSCCAY